MVKTTPTWYTWYTTAQGYLAVGLGLGAVCVGGYLALTRPLLRGNNLDISARVIVVGAAILAPGVFLLRWAARERAFQRARAQAAVYRPGATLPGEDWHARPAHDATGQFHDLRLRPNWKRLALYAGWIYLIFWAFTILLLVVLDYPWDSLVAEAALSAVIVALGPVILWIVGAQQHLLASDWSFEDRSRLGGARRIAWEDATLFAICPPRASSGLAIVYELSSATTTIRWVRLRQPMLWMPSRPETATRPNVPFEAYDQRAQAMIDYIQAATGLVLQDLR
jgi:hypothetical protein